MGLPLFEEFPRLRGEIPWLKLGDFPTRVHRLKRLGKELGCRNLWIKRDDESGKLYGGNKVRKLEFLLADAEKKNAKVILTCGRIGSNHCLASTIYGSKLGFKSVLVLYHQPVTELVMSNLLLDHYFGAELHRWLPQNGRENDP